MARQLTVLVLAFAVGVAVAELLGAANLGVALGVGQLTFIAAAVWLMLKS